MCSSRLLPALAALAGLLLPSCKTAGLASVNLDELMSEQHRFRYAANIQSGTDYLLQSIIDPRWLEDAPADGGPKLKPIEDPAGVALQNLLSLRERGMGLSGSFLEAERVRHYARYAVFCPSALCRERAFLELIPHADRLQVEEIRSPPELAANAVELSEGLRGLREVLVQLSAKRGKTDETTRRDFAAACEVLGQLELDLEGGRRLLRIIAAFGQLPGMDEDDLAPMRGLSLDVQRRVVALALMRGRHDPNGRVRAAAFEANISAYGDPFLDEALLALSAPVQLTEDRRVVTSERFGLAPEGGYHPETYVRVFAILRADGLPGLSGGTPADAIQRRLAHLQAIMQVTYDFSTYSDRVRSLAMATLGEVSGAGFKSLREEDWGRWWATFKVTETARLNRAAGVESGDGS